jgi:excisionase family DNA binding protein
VTGEALDQDYRARLAELLGEPVMVDDPLITTAQAAALLRVPASRVVTMVRAGHLRARSRAHRRLMLSDVVRAGIDRWTSIAEAGVLLGLGPTGVRRLIAAGLLEAHGNELPLRGDDVDQLTRSRQGWLTLSAAASALGVDAEVVHVMLREGTLTHTRDVARPVYQHELTTALKPSRSG